MIKAEFAAHQKTMKVYAIIQYKHTSINVSKRVPFLVVTTKTERVLESKIINKAKYYVEDQWYIYNHHIC